jgi:hypothetical protein
MRKLSCVILGLFVIVPASYASCPAGDPASQVQAIQAQVDSIGAALGANGGGPDVNGHPQAPASKPDESSIDDVIACAQPIANSGAASRIRATAEMQLSTLYGYITQYYRSGLGQQGPGKISFFDLKSATQVDSSFEDAWITYGQVIDGMLQESWFDQQGIKIGLGISISDEKNYAIQGLQALQNLSSQGQQILSKLQQD